MINRRRGFWLFFERFAVSGTPRLGFPRTGCCVLSERIKRNTIRPQETTYGMDAGVSALKLTRHTKHFGFPAPSAVNSRPSSEEERQVMNFRSQIGFIYLPFFLSLRQHAQIRAWKPSFWVPLPQIAFETPVIHTVRYSESRRIVFLPRSARVHRNRCAEIL